MTSETDEFTFAEQDAAPPRPRTPLPVSRRGSTWSVVGAALILGGVLASPGPIGPPPGGGVSWNALDLDLTVEPTVTWTVDAGLPESFAPLELLGESGGVIVVAQNRSVRIEGATPPSTPVLGLDAATGAERLRIEDENQTCQLGADAITCVTDRSSPDAGIVSYPTDGGESTGAGYPGAMGALLLDDGGMLVIEGGGTALADLVRLDASGAELWREQLSFSGGADPTYTPIELVEGTVLTQGGMFDLASGGDPASLPTLETADDGATRTLLVDGATQLVLADGDELTIPPDEMWLNADDTFGGPVSLQEEADGAVVARWLNGEITHAPPEGGSCHTSIRLDGVLIQSCVSAPDLSGFKLIGVDQVTGEHLWERQDSLGTMLATSDTVVIPTFDGVEGVDPRTGEARWSIPVPSGLPDLAVVDGGILISTTSVVMRLDAAPSS